VRWDKPTRIIGLGQHGKDKGWAGSIRPRDTPRHPAKSGVLHTATTVVRNESPRAVFHGRTGAGEPVSTGYGTVVGCPKKPRREESSRIR